MAFAGPAAIETAVSAVTASATEDKDAERTIAVLLLSTFCIIGREDYLCVIPRIVFIRGRRSSPCEMSMQFSLEDLIPIQRP
jgi:hypothetical protein